METSLKQCWPCGANNMKYWLSRFLTQPITWNIGLVSTFGLSHILHIYKIQIYVQQRYIQMYEIIFSFSLLRHKFWKWRPNYLSWVHVWIVLPFLPFQESTLYGRTCNFFFVAFVLESSAFFKKLGLQVALPPPNSTPIFRTD